ncbi:MAG TPA: acetyl-CoA carboxylase biotin carboxyl carrier protein [Lacipirellulaceae bacterium]|nr:acetyl-CoA carboxylase biotin carboxyl carrier protein [Lacipirellulaceae bacterium]
MTTNSGSVPGDVFDVRKVRKFIELMNEHDLTEIDLRQGDQRIRLRRGPETVTVSTAPTASFTSPPTSVSHGGPPEAKPGGTAPDDGTLSIRSPMVGTFYSAASPDTPPFVKVGDQVGPETTVCIVEAMKVFNEIPAECSGRIVAILAQNGDAVEFGQPLFRVEPT